MKGKIESDTNYVHHKEGTILKEIPNLMMSHGEALGNNFNNYFNELSCIAPNNTDGSKAFCVESVNYVSINKIQDR